MKLNLPYVILITFFFPSLIFSQEFLQVKYSINDILKQRQSFANEKVKSVTVKSNNFETIYEIDKEGRIVRIPGAFTNSNINKNILLIQDSTLSDTNLNDSKLSKLNSHDGENDSSYFNINSDRLNIKFSENEIGLSFSYPQSWFIVKGSEISGKTESFEGLIIFDTTLLPGDLNIFIISDNSNEFNTDMIFNERFILNQDTVIAYKSKPVQTDYETRFGYCLFFSDSQIIRVIVNMLSKYYEQMLETIENSIRTINIQKPHSKISTDEESGE